MGVYWSYNKIGSLLTCTKLGSMCAVFGKRVRRSAQVLRSFACPETIREEAKCALASHLFIEDQSVRWKLRKRKNCAV